MVNYQKYSSISSVALTNLYLARKENSGKPTSTTLVGKVVTIEIGKKSYNCKLYVDPLGYHFVDFQNSRIKPSLGEYFCIQLKHWRVRPRWRQFFWFRDEAEYPSKPKDPLWLDPNKSCLKHKKFNSLSVSTLVKKQIVVQLPWATEEHRPRTRRRYVYCFPKVIGIHALFCLKRLRKVKWNKRTRFMGMRHLYPLYGFSQANWLHYPGFRCANFNTQSLSLSVLSWRFKLLFRIRKWYKRGYRIKRMLLISLKKLLSTRAQLVFSSFCLPQTSSLLLFDCFNKLNTYTCRNTLFINFYVLSALCLPLSSAFEALSTSAGNITLHYRGCGREYLNRAKYPLIIGRSLRALRHPITKIKPGKVFVNRYNKIARRRQKSIASYRFYKRW